MTAETEDRRDFTRYAPLGLIGNPFALPENSSAPVSECEIGSKSNELLKAIVERSREDAPKPLWIDKGVARSLDVGRLYKLTWGKVVPVALIGYNSSFYSFREVLPIAGLYGGFVDWSRVRLEPGFAVYSFRRFIHSGGVEGYQHDYDVTPTVDAVLGATDPILHGEFPTATPPAK